MKTLLKIVLFTLLVGLSQAIIVHFFPIPVPPEVKKMDAYLARHTDVLYFGDSILETRAWGDNDLRKIPAMLSDLLPGQTVGMLAHPADEPNLYEQYCRYIARSTDKPRFVVVPISMRSFSEEWENNPGKQFGEEALYFRYGRTPIYPFLPFLISFHVLQIYPRSMDEFYRMPVVYKGKQNGVIGDYYGDQYKTYTDDHMRKQISLYYLYSLSPNDRYVQSLREVAKYCRKDKVIFYITPINFELGRTYNGNLFTKQVTENIATLKRSLKDTGVPIIDLSHDLHESKFFWQDEKYLNEHLNETGRQYIAKKVSEEIKKRK